MSLFARTAQILNKAVVPLMRVPLLDRKLARTMAIVTYTGRKSGSTFSFPVGYVRKGDDMIVIGVAMPEQKSWWRNFYPDAQPISVDIGGQTHSGTAVAQRDPDRGVRVQVTLDKA